MHWSCWAYFQSGNPCKSHSTWVLHAQLRMRPLGVYWNTLVFSVAVMSSRATLWLYFHIWISYYCSGHCHWCNEVVLEKDLLWIWLTVDHSKPQVLQWQESIWCSASGLLEAHMCHCYENFWKVKYLNLMYEQWCVSSHWVHPQGCANLWCVGTS